LSLVSGFAAVAVVIGVADWVESASKAAQALNEMASHPLVGRDVAVGRARDARDVKAPVSEVLHCPLAFAGVHLLKELPENGKVAYHYCKTLNDEVSQCLLYDGTGPDARLIGVEYLVSNETYLKMPAEEQVYWHDHKYEVDAGLLRSLMQSGAEEKAILAKVRTLWGKIYHTWASGSNYPRGPARLFWSVTGEQPFLRPQAMKLPSELETAPRTVTDHR
jgi:hypothetical protein